MDKQIIQPSLGLEGKSMKLGKQAKVKEMFGKSKKFSKNKGMNSGSKFMKGK